MALREAETLAVPTGTPAAGARALAEEAGEGAGRHGAGHDRSRGAEDSREWAGRRWPRLPWTIAGCFVVLGLFVCCGVFADVVAPRDPIAQNLRARLAPPGVLGGTSAYLLGADQLGRDLLSRLIFGARTSLSIGAAGMAIGLCLGSVCGGIAGYARGVVDDVVMFLVDAYMALPFLAIALTVVALFGNSWPVLIGLAGMAGWGHYTRLARGQVLGVREQPYVAAARALGAQPVWVLWRHVLPNIAGPMIVLATYELTAVILLEASLSFLGLGVKPPTPSWGSMLGEGRGYLNTAWWVGVLPGLAIVLVTTSISLAGDWLRDVLDPTVQEEVG